MAKNLIGCGVVVLLLGVQFAIISFATWLVCVCFGIAFLWRYAIMVNVLLVMLNSLVLSWRKAR